ncbi:MAG: glutamate-5-semialdehyde dehydrogenase [Clostridia bacterium]|nr:glutamate-5-semialdehyde dehydrogenase [Clostridia bacterium]
MADMNLLAHKARQAALKMSGLSLNERNQALMGMCVSLQAHQAAIFEANQKDLAAAQQEGLAAPLLKRLKFDEKKLAEVCEGLRSLAELPDPIGHTQLSRELMPGLDLYRVSCPIGVIGVIFESRPDALVQIASLCLKSGNSVLLKGGREALNTNRALHAALIEGAGLIEGWAGLMESRDDVAQMLKMDDCIDLIIPRGSNAFVRYIMDNSRIPVLGHADGVCHVYVDADADLDMAVAVAADSKTQAVAVCNAMETLLVHEAIASTLLPRLQADLPGVRLLGCPKTRAIIHVEPADEDDWKKEYLDSILSIKVVASLGEAVDHINQYGSGHTDCIVTQNEEAARLFTNQVDSAGVYVNCSTRFADGFRYGFGAEVGIATGKIHARGPMGLEGLCTYKYKLIGHGQTVGAVARGELSYTHKEIDKTCPL